MCSSAVRLDQLFAGCRHACVRRPIQAPAAMKSSVATVEAAVIRMQHAAAAPASPASSRRRMAIDAVLVSG